LLTENTSYYKSLTSIQTTGPKSAIISMRNSTAHMVIGANFITLKSPSI
jgi:hypothetical protein